MSAGYLVLGGLHDTEHATAREAARAALRLAHRGVRPVIKRGDRQVELTRRLVPRAIVGTAADILGPWLEIQLQ